MNTPHSPLAAPPSVEAPTRARPRAGRMARLALLTAGLALAGLALWAGLRAWSPAPVSRYATAQAVRTTIEDTVLASGTIEAQVQVSVGAQVSGQLKALHVALGDRVSQGQLVAQIDSLPQQNALRTAEAQLALVKAQKQATLAALKQATLSDTRQKRLYQQEAGSRQDMEAAEASLDTLRAELASLEAQIRQADISVDTARVNLGYTRITSPIDGVVVAVVTKQGQTVNANQQAPTLIKVARLDTLTVKAEISEADVVRVRPGQKIYFTILGEPDVRREAVLRTVEPAPTSIQSDTTSSSTSSSSSSSTSSSSTSAVYYNGLFDVPNADGTLRISMTAQVYIVLARAEDALTVPASALRQDGDGAYVLVLGPGGEARPQRVRVGINNRITAEIVDGLDSGQQVVVGDASDAPAPTAQRRGPPMRL